MAKIARDETRVARSPKPTTTEDPKESLVRIFFRGFFMPVRLLGRGIAWLSHQPPLKQLGHGLRWFFRLQFVRFIGRMLGFRFFRGSVQELKLVTWPTKREGVRLTSAVVMFSVAFSLVLACVDYGLDKLFKHLLLK